MRTTQRLAALAAASTLVLMTSGCAVADLLGGADEPVRDASGEIVEAADADAFSIRVGDCLETTEAFAEATEVESVPTVPCGDPHDAEVYATTLLDDGDFPGDEAVAKKADELCYGEFEAFVGLPYEDSALDFTMLYPSEQSWDLMDDREVVCILVDLDGGVTGSMAAAGR
ncbi:septum formation family protein [Cellulomonas carbonis]|uniref:septum formation family protein n=1 Tax=Cellulomonas carbonis TaxID=1386092 RepID=UPI000A9DD471|nr:septum formation family protein [Cellulomonas carbonis]GGC03248.1 hypothetical protein GCM10010972_15400 [Cellulomonas carbonis]